MATVVTQTISEDGIIPSLTTLDASNTFTNTGREFIFYTNESAGAKTITVTAVVSTLDLPTYGDVTKADATLSVAAGETAMIGPFPTLAYNAAESAVTFAITPYVAETRDSAAIMTLSLG